MQYLEVDGSNQYWDETDISDERWAQSHQYNPIWMKSYGFQDRAEHATSDFITLLDNHLPGLVEDWETEVNSYRFHCGDLEVFIEVSSDEECFMLPPKLINSTFAVSRTRIDPLRAHLRNIVKQEAHHLNNFLDFALAVLRVLEEVCGSLEEWRRLDKARVIPLKSSDPDVQRPVGLDTGPFQPRKLLNANLSSTRDAADAIFGLTVEEICETIPSTWKILHVESVLRRDLVQRFISCRIKLLRRIRDLNLQEAELKRLNSPGNEKINQGRTSREDIAQELVRPRLTFHGTQRHLVASIVRHGFMLPGTMVGNSIIASPRTSVVYHGRGIYSSPASFYAMSYAGRDGAPTTPNERPGVRLFVCATLMGRTDKGDPGVHKPLVDGIDSQATADGFEYVVYDEAQILPCFVIHLDLATAAAAETMRAIQSGPAAFMERQKHELFRRQSQSGASPGDLQRIKEAKKAAVQKWFPYGFGPAKGTSFVIEEIGEVSDDEENYGDYQAAREEAWKFLEDDDRDADSGANAERDWTLNVKKKGAQGSWMDEYTSARNEHHCVKRTKI